MHPVTIVLLVILVILIGLLVGLYFFGKKTQKKQEEQQAQIEASNRPFPCSLLIRRECHLRNQSPTDGHRPDTEASPPLQDANR